MVFKIATLILLVLLFSGCGDGCLKTTAKIMEKAEKITPLMNAARDGDKEKVKKLIENGVDVNKKDKYGESALVRAVEKNHPEIVEILLKHGAKPNVRFTRGMTTPLLVASINGYDKVVDVLLKNGAKIDTIDIDGGTSLMRAANMGHINVIKILLENNAKVNIINKFNRTALDTALRVNSQQIIYLLRKHGAKTAAELAKH